MGAPPAGWYPDPTSGHGVRYWDGVRWTEQTAPTPPPTSWGGWQPPPAFASGAPSGQPARLSTWVTVLVVAFTFLLIGLVFLGLQSEQDDARTRAAVTTIAPPMQPVAPEYHVKLDANGDPEYVPFGQGGSVPPTAAVPRALVAQPTGADLVDPTTARAIVQNLWDVRRTAIATRNTAVIAQLETGSALSIDAHRVCGCSSPDRFGPASGITVAVQHQRAYPASFVAQLDTTFNGTRWAAVLVFLRNDASDPWRLAFAGGGQPIGDAAGFPFAVGPDGFARPAPVGAAQPPAASLLADYWQRVKDDGTTALPPTLLPATLTDKWASHIVTSRQGEVNGGNGLIGYYRFYADPLTFTASVSLADGTVLQCASIQEEKTWLPVRGEAILQPASRRNWGSDLAPGSYRAVLEVSEYTPCFQYRPSGEPIFQANGVTPPDDVRVIGLARVAPSA